MDVEKICRTCLSLSGPFLSIYDGASGSGNAGCLADMLRDFTKTKPRREDNLPEKVCLNCISEINHCFSFKLKCENSNRTLRQLLPNALPEEPDPVVAVKPKLDTTEQAVQTSAITTTECEVQTDALPATIKTNPDSLANDDEVDDFYDLAGLDDPMGSPAKSGGENIILHVEKDNIKFATEMIYNQSTGELLEQAPKSLDTMSSKQKEYKFTIFNNANGETEIEAAATPQMSTRKSAAKLQQQLQAQTQVASPVKRSARRRVGIKPEEQDQQLLDDVPTAPKQLKTFVQHKSSNGPLTNAPLDAVGKLKYHCDRCNAGFALEKSLAIHRRQNGCTNRNFKCNECKRVFVSKEHLTEHQATHNNYSCNECGQMCESKEHLGRHMVQGHKRNLRNQCNICQKVFTMLSTLRDHMRIHTGEKPFVCSICSKGFTQNANLRQHMLRHSDFKRFKCDLCGHSFVTKAELSSHARTHTGVKPYECEVCSAKFTTSCSLAKHKRKHTGERPYACDLCPMRFTALNVLKNHRRTHTGERPYVCPHCSKSFTQRGDCQMHQRTHQGEKIYICPVCALEFKSMDDMRTHVLVHGQQDKRLVHFTLMNSKENGLEQCQENPQQQQELEEEDEEEHALLL